MTCVFWGWVLFLIPVHFVINPIVMTIITLSFGWAGTTGRIFSHFAMGSAVYGRYYKDSRAQWAYRFLKLFWVAVFVGGPFTNQGRWFFCQIAEFALSLLPYVVSALGGFLSHFFSGT